MFTHPQLLGCLMVIFMAVPHSNTRRTPRSYENPKFSIGPCGNGCKGSRYDDDILRYNPELEYKYKMSSNMDIKMPSVEGQFYEKNSLKINADVYLQFLNNCNYAIRVDKLTIKNNKHGTRESINQDNYPATFTWENGKIDPSICMNERDNEYSRNIKRAIISSLQVSSWDSSNKQIVNEVDMFGVCQTEVTMDQYRGDTVIKKLKNLDSCNDYGSDSSFPYYTKSIPKFNPFLKSILESTTVISNGIVDNLKITETYQYNPFTNYGPSSNNRISVNTELQFQSKRKSTTSFEGPYTQHNILFKNQNNLINSAVPTDPILPLQKLMNYESIIPEDSIDQFNELVDSLKTSTTNDLMKTYERINREIGNPDEAKYAFWDALVKSKAPGTVEFVRIMKENSGEIPTKFMNKFLRNLPDIEIAPTDLKSVTKYLADGVDYPTYVQLGKLGKNCIDRFGNQGEDITEFINELSKPITTGYENNNELYKQDMMIASLKGLGNLKHLPPSLISKIMEYVKNPKINTRVRAAALQTLIDIKPYTQQEMDQFALEILKNNVEDVECRILGFLLFMKNNTNPHSAGVIKEFLDSGKPGNQVGSFISSYLRNIRNSQRPEKETLKNIFGGVTWNSKIPTDFDKFSRNYQYGRFLSSLNLGFNTEADVIYATDSFVPRSVSISLGAQLFGRDIDVFDIGVRAEKVNYLLEKYLGPKSYIRSTKVESVADDFLNGFSRFKNEIIPNGAKEDYAPPIDDYVNIDLTLRSLGNTDAYKAYHFDKNRHLFTGDLSSYAKRKIRGIKEIPTKFQEFDMNYKKNFQRNLLSRDKNVFPTSCGFPLRVSVDLSGNFDFKFNGQNTLNEFFSNRQNAKFISQLIPNANLQLSGMVIMDTPAMEYGFKTKSLLRTATGATVNLHPYEQNGLQFKLSLPKSKQELITIKNDILLYVKESEKQPESTLLRSEGPRYEYNRCINLFPINLCGQFNMPSIRGESLLGPTSISLSLQSPNNIDTYQLTTFYKVDDNNAVRKLEWNGILQASGPTVKKEYKITGEITPINNGNGNLNLRMVTPNNKFGFTALKETTHSKILYEAILTNNQYNRLLRLGADINRGKSQTDYKPFFQTASGKEPLDQLRNKRSLQNLNIDGVVSKIYSDDAGTTGNYKWKFDDLKLDINRPIDRSYKLQGDIAITERSLPSSNLKFSYGSSRNTEPNFVTFSNGLYSSPSSSTPPPSLLTDYYASNPLWPSDIVTPVPKDIPESTSFMEFTSSQLPMLNNRMILSTKQAPDNAAMRAVEWNFGSAKESQLRALNTLKNSPGDRKGSLIVKWIPHNLMSTSTFSTDNNLWTGQQVLSNLMGKERYSVRSAAAFDKNNVGDLELKLVGKCGEKIAEILAIRNKKGDNESLLKLNAMLNSQEKLDIVTDLTYSFIPNIYNLQADTKLRFNNDKLYRLYAGYKNMKNNREFSLSSSTPDKEKYFKIDASMINENDELKINSGAYLKNILDTSVVYNRNPRDVEGHFKVILSKLKTNLDSNFNLKRGRSLNTDAEITWNTESSGEKKIRLSTNNEMNEIPDGRQYTTKSVLKIPNYEFELNGKGETNKNGPYNGELEYQSPHRRAVFNLSKKSMPETNKDSINFSMNHYKTPSQIPTKILAVIEGKKIFRILGDYDWNSNVEYVTPKSENALINFGINNGNQNGAYEKNIKLSTRGSLIPREVNFEGSSSYSDDTLYQIRFITVHPASYSLKMDIGDDYKTYMSGQLKDNTLKNSIMYYIRRNGNSPVSFKWDSNNEFAKTPEARYHIKSLNNLIFNEEGELDYSSEYLGTGPVGQFVANWKTNKTPEKKFDMTYGYVRNVNEPSWAAISSEYFNGNSKNSIAAKGEIDENGQSAKITLTGSSDTRGLYVVVADIDRWNSEKGFSTGISLKHNDEVTRRFLLNLLPKTPGYDLNVQYTMPKGQYKLKTSLNEYRNYMIDANGEIEWPSTSTNNNDINQIDYSIRGKYNPNDNIDIKANLNAPYFKINKWYANVSRDLQTPEMATRNLLNIETSSDNGPLYKGTLNYSQAITDDKYKFEVNGFLKRNNDNEVPILLRYTRDYLKSNDGNQIGVVRDLTMQMDKFDLEMQAQLSKGLFLIKKRHTYTGESYIDSLSYNSKYDAEKGKSLRDLTLQLSTKEFLKNGKDLVLNASIGRENGAINSQMGVRWGNENKISYSNAININAGVHKLELPSRTMLLETYHEIQGRPTEGQVKFGSSIFLDYERNKNKALKWILNGNYEIDSKRTIKANGNTVITIPTSQSQSKDLNINTSLNFNPTTMDTKSIRMDFDIFKNSADKIKLEYNFTPNISTNGLKAVRELRITSKGLQMDTTLRSVLLASYDKINQSYDLDYVDVTGRMKSSGVDFDLQFGKINFAVKVLDELLYKYNGSLSYAKDFIKFDENYEILGRKYTKGYKLTNKPEFIVSVGSKEGAIDRSVEIATRAIFGQVANFDVKLVNNSKRSNVLGTSVFLDTRNFMNTDSNINLDNLKYILDTGKRDILSILNKGKATLYDIKRQINRELAVRSEKLKKLDVIPQSTRQLLKNESSTIKRELYNDFNVPLIMEYIRPYLEDLYEIIKRIINDIVDIDELKYRIKKLYNETKEAIKKSIPNIFKNGQIDYKKLMGAANKLILKAIKNGKFAIDYVKFNTEQLRKRARELFNLGKEKLEPYIDRLKDIISDIQNSKTARFIRSLQIPEHAKQALDRIKRSPTLNKIYYNYLRPIMKRAIEKLTDEEFREFVKDLISFIKKIINNEPYALKNEMQNLYNKTSTMRGSIKSKIANTRDLLRDNIGNYMEIARDRIPPALISLSTYKPIMNGAISAIRQLGRKLKELVGKLGPYSYEFIKNLRHPSTLRRWNPLNLIIPRSLNPLDMITPRPGIGFVIKGQNLITMNGQSYTVNSNGVYKLLYDVDNQFNIIAKLKDDALEYITVESAGDTITIYPDNMVKLNNEKSDFPIFTKELMAIKNYNSLDVHIGNGGIQVSSIDGLEICSVIASGFYHGRLSGLLGTFNYEPYTDFITPDGTKIDTSSTFPENYYAGNERSSHSMSLWDQNVPTDVDECKQYFNRPFLDSLGYAPVDETAYHNLCSAVAKSSSPEKGDIACKMLMAYSLANNNYNGRVYNIPRECGKCNVEGKDYEIGSEVNVEFPNSKAEMVVILQNTENTKPNYDHFMRKIIPSLKESLNKGGIKDLKLVLIGVGPEEIPSLYTTNGELALNDQTNIKFESPPNERSAVNRLIRDLKYSLGKSGINKGIKLAKDYPFNPNAAKAIVVIPEDSQLYPSFLLRELNRITSYMNVMTSSNKNVPIFTILPKISNSPTLRSEENETSISEGYDFRGYKIGRRSIQYMSEVLNKLRNSNESFGRLPLYSSMTGGAVLSIPEANVQGADDAFIDYMTNTMVHENSYKSCTCTYKNGIYPQISCPRENPLLSTVRKYMNKMSYR